jgi:hypothetical protein
MRALLFFLIIVPLLAAQEQRSTATIDSLAAFDVQHYAHVYFYRPPQHMFWGDAAILRLDGKKIVRIGNGKRVSLKLKPGRYVLDLNDRPSALEIDAEPDQQYYVRITERWGGCCTFAGKLKTVDPHEATKEYNKQKPVEEKSKMTREPLFDLAEPRQ